MRLWTQHGLRHSTPGARERFPRCSAIISKSEDHMSTSEHDAVVDEHDETTRRTVSRRLFLKGSSVAVASAGAASVATVVVDRSIVHAQDATPAATPAAV